MRSLINKYTDAIQKNCADPNRISENSVAYWRNYYFSNMVKVLIPLSLITVIPGITLSLYLEFYMVAFFDLLVFTSMVYIGFGKGLQIETRKMLFMAVIYFAASFLLYYIGPVGPGTLFLYAACIFGIVILSRRFAYLWSVINLVICILFAIVIHLNLSPVEDVNEASLLFWIAVAANVIFLSFLSSAMLPGLFKGLSKTIRRQNELQVELLEKTSDLETSVHEIKQKNEELERFAYVTSHDLQEPLRMITGFLSQLDRKYGDQLDDKGRQYIQFAHGGATRMRQIILDLLEYSRVSNQEHQKEEIDFQELIDDYRSLRHRLIEQKSAQIFLDAPSAVMSYKTPIVQVLHNLIDNALKYSKEGVPPEVHVSVSEEQDHWSLSVKDNGIGIDPEYFDKIFILFSRLHPNEYIDGTGIGLSIVKKIVERLGGEIHVDSEPEKGTCFILRVPK